MNKVTVVIPTLYKPHQKICEQYLRLIPFGCDVVWVSDGLRWPEAVNIGIRKAGKNDVLIMDDDVFLMPKTFLHLETVYDHADMFGFKLLFPDGTIQHAGGFYKAGMIGHLYYREKDDGRADLPMYVCHVTTSLCLIKNHVFDAVGLFTEEFKGEQFEDMDFCFRVIKEGMKILYIPGNAIHIESLTKRQSMTFIQQMSINQKELMNKYKSDDALINEISKYPLPFAKNEQFVAI